MKPRAPVYYRGVQVGEVAGCELGPHSQTVRILVDIQDRYAPLVRVNSVFWNAGGVDVNVGLSGADISAQSFKTMIAGGIDFATPDAGQKVAPQGTSFRLYDKPRDEWLAWAPDIEIGRDVANTDPTGEQSARGDR
jgi:paraquat-inducible protein B